MVIKAARLKKMKMISKVPDYIVHYSRGEPFRSLTSVPADQLYSVISNLNEKIAWGLNRFSDPNYFQQRLEVENKMRVEFLALGGEPVLSHPIYFFLGRNPRFEEASLNIGYMIELSSIDIKSISFSYGDTMLSFNQENRKIAGEQYSSPLCNRLYLKSDLESLFGNKLYPKDSPLSVEAHLWVQPADAVVKKLER